MRIDGGTTSVVADGFERPVGVAVAPGGAIFVSDEVRGTVERVEAGTRGAARRPQRPAGPAVSGGRLLRRRGRRRAARSRCRSKAATPRSVATGLPVGTGDGVRGTLNGLPEMIPGPISPFAGLDADADGRLYVGGDARGVVLVLEREA